VRGARLSPGGSEAESPYLLGARNIWKRYGDVVANRGVDLSVQEGEIHALLGENGSGKTTLLSILYGLVPPDEGTITYQGRPVIWDGPHHARDTGISMVPQQFRLVPTLTVEENVVLAIHGRRGHRQLLVEVRAQMEVLQERYGLSLDPGAAVGSLSVGERQRVEILRALFFNPKLLLLDEPTSVLTPQESEALYGALHRIVGQERLSLVLTTHRIGEVFGLADRVTVLRNGLNIATFGAEQLSRDELVRTMIGEDRAARAAHPERAAATSDPLVRVEDLELEHRAAQVAGVPPISRTNFDAKAGEIVGVAGVEGNGQLSLELLLAGLLRPTNGRIVLRDPAGRSIAETGADHNGGGTFRQHVGYIPSDRNRLGVARGLSVGENLLLRQLAATPALSRAPAMRKDQGETVERLIEEFGIEPRDPGIPVRNLSGGNAQKVVLARELSRSPPVTLAAQPTAGLDVRVTGLVRDRLRREAERGSAVIIISSDLDELFELCHQIGVIYQGRFVGFWPREQFDRREIGAAMGGLTAP
jgi:simple sugar transport system ATP-binding protein